MAPPAGSKEVVLMCTGLDEKKQNELYLLTKEMEKTQLLRDKVTAGMYDSRTTHLVVGPSFGKTDKLLCALAAGIPIVHAEYVKKSHKKGDWLALGLVGSYDVGRPTEQLNRLYIPPLAARQVKKKGGGIFQGWTVVVLLEDARQKEVYRRMLELGGAVVHRWTLTHLLDSQARSSKDYKGLTHVVARPGMLMQNQFQQFLAINDKGPGGPSVVTHIYLGDYLTKKEFPPIPMYDVRNPEMWPLTEESWKVEELKEAGLSAWKPLSRSEGVPWHHDALRQVRDVQLQEQVEEPSPDYSDLEDHFDFPEMANSPETEKRGNGTKRRRIAQESGEDEEIEVLGVVKASSSSQPPSMSPAVARLRAKAAELIQKEQTQSRIDSWVITSPSQRISQAASQTQQVNSPESPVLQQSQYASDSPVPLSPLRRAEMPASTLKRTGSNNTSVPNHFLSLRRSGSTNSARSLFASEASQDSLDLDGILEEGSSEKGIKAKSTFCHTLQVMRRNRVGNEVGEEGRNQRARDAHLLGPDLQSPSPVSNSMCQNIWTCLNTRETNAEANLQQDDGWVAALDLVKKLVNYSRFLPVAALHRCMQEALMSHGDVKVRQSALTTLMYCFDCRPSCPNTTHYYLELMARKRPHVDTLGKKWEFDPQEPWVFIETMIEKVLKEEEGCAGAALCLQLIVQLLEKDMQGWFDAQVESDSLSIPNWRPLVSHILFPQSSVAWGRRLERLCSLYARSLENQSIKLISSLRTLVGLAAQLAAHKERTSEPSTSNQIKIEMARWLAGQLVVLGLSGQRMTEELFMLKPDWLSSLLSTALLDRLCGRQREKSPPSLRYLITNYINVPLNMDANKENQVDETPAPSSPLSKLAIASPTPKSSAKKTPKIAVTKRNKYGEVPLHGHAKKGNLEKMRECLATPGVDVNAVDHAGWTPLHEAVAAGSVAAVSLLLNHSAPRTLLHYFSPGNIKAGRVDLLLGDLERGMNPVQEAVSNSNNEMVSLFLETVTTKSGFPSVKVLLSAKTKAGETMGSLAKSDSMKAIMNRFSGGVSKPDCPGTLSISNLEMFKIFLDQALVNYISAHNLAAAYATFKGIDFEEVVAEAKKGADVRPNANQQQFCGSIDLREGLKNLQFNKRPRFDLSRTEQVKNQDLRDFEKLMYFKKEKKFPLMEKGNHPASTTLVLLKTC